MACRTGVLTPGQDSDKTTFPALIEGLRLAHDVVADRGFFSRAIIELIEANGATAYIPSQSNVQGSSARPCTSVRYTSPSTPSSTFAC